jgi:hypothetical protein
MSSRLLIIAAVVAYAIDSLRALARAPNAYTMLPKARSAQERMEAEKDR